MLSLRSSYQLLDEPLQRKHCTKGVASTSVILKPQVCHKLTYLIGAQIEIITKKRKRGEKKGKPVQIWGQISRKLVEKRKKFEEKPVEKSGKCLTKRNKNQVKSEEFFVKRQEI